MLLEEFHDMMLATDRTIREDFHSDYRDLPHVCLQLCSEIFELLMVLHSLEIDDPTLMSWSTFPHADLELELWDVLFALCCLCNKTQIELWENLNLDMWNWELHAEYHNLYYEFSRLSKLFCDLTLQTDWVKKPKPLETPLALPVLVFDFISFLQLLATHYQLNLGDSFFKSLSKFVQRDKARHEELS